jgi:hypothetical protein
MHFFADWKIIPQDIVKLTRPRDDFSSCEKRHEKRTILIQRRSLSSLACCAATQDGSKDTP